MKILVVDDEPINREVLGAPLKAAGHAVLTAGDGIEALAVLERKPVDVVISDILMPNMDGYRLCYEMRVSERLRHLPFIFYTSIFTSPGDEKLCYDLGADKFLQKPASSEEVLAALQEVTHRDQESRPRRAPPVGMAVLKEYSTQLVNKLVERNSALGTALERMNAGEAHFRTLFESAADGIFLFSADLACQDANACYMEMLGYSREEIIGMNVTLFAAEHERPMVQPEIANLLAGRAYKKEWQLLRRNGSLVSIELSAATLSDERVLVIVRDITGQRRAEAAIQESGRMLSTLMDNLPGMVYRCADGPNWIPEFVSAGILPLTGYRPEQMIGPAPVVTPTTMIHPEDLERVRSEIQRANVESRQYTIEYRLITAAGEEKWVWERGCSLRGPSGEALGIEGFITDVTARKQAEGVQKIRAAELERFHQMSVGRELQMIELKKEVNALARQAGRPAPYDLSFLEET